MPIKLFSVPALDPAAGEHEVNAFCAQQRVVSIERRLVTVHDRPVWCFCIEYLQSSSPQGAHAAGDFRSRVDYRLVLNDDDFRVFSKLRELRKAVAEEEKAPVFTIFTNEQLAAMARQRPTSLAELQRIDGIGEGKAGRYGDRVLGVVGAFGRALAAPESPASVAAAAAAGEAAPPAPTGAA
jgi:superfamily II DNA helicase RecQ